MRIGLTAAVVLSLLALVACKGGGEVEDTATPALRSSGDTLTPTPPKELRPLSKQSALGEAVTVDAGLLKAPAGEPPLSGQAEITFRTVDRQTTASPEARAKTGGGGPAFFDSRQGVYVVVHYTVTNNSDGALQPETHVNGMFTLADSRGREWIPAIYGNYGFAVAYAFALQVGGMDSREFIGPGKSLETAIVFDISEDASGLRLRSEGLDLEVSLGQ